MLYATDLWTSACDESTCFASRVVSMVEVSATLSRSDALTSRSNEVMLELSSSVYDCIVCVMTWQVATYTSWCLSTGALGLTSLSICLNTVLSCYCKIAAFQCEDDYVYFTIKLLLIISWMMSSQSSACTPTLTSRWRRANSSGCNSSQKSNSPHSFTRRFIDVISTWCDVICENTNNKTPRHQRCICHLCVLIF